MAQPAEQASPEEKLLKVIQGDKKADASKSPPGPSAQPAAPAAAVAKEKPAAPPPATPAKPAAAVPKIQPAATPAAGEPKEAAKPAATATPAAAPADKRKKAEPPASAPRAGGGLVEKRRPKARLGIGFANKCLVAIVLIMVGFAGFEIWANVAPRMATPPPPVKITAPVAGAGQGPEASAIAQIVEAFEKKPMLRNSDEVAAPPPIKETGEGPAPERPPDWQKSMNLIGFSSAPGAPTDQMEAIIVDTRENKMYFLRVGQTLSLGGKEYTLQQIEGDRAILSDGTQKVVIE